MKEARCWNCKFFIKNENQLAKWNGWCNLPRAGTPNPSVHKAYRHAHDTEWCDQHKSRG